MRRFFSSHTLLALALAAPFLLACGPRDERRFEIAGTVVSVDRDRERVTLDHEPIPSFMDAMRMEFSVREAWAFQAMSPGDRVTGTLVVAGDRSWIEGISVSKPPVPAPDAPPAPAGTPVDPTPGSTPPPVPLVRQDGRTTSLESMRGKAVLLTFVYTRCPLPDQCPLMTTNFRKVHDAVAADPNLRDRTRLVTVTIDPTYDTPAVMRAYGEAYAGGPAASDHWDFATGEPDDIRKLATYFGLHYSAETGTIVHSLRTALIAPDGTLVRVYRGNDWSPEAVTRDLLAATS